jgi:hypothetical protein
MRLRYAVKPAAQGRRAAIRLFRWIGVPSLSLLASLSSVLAATTGSGTGAVVQDNTLIRRILEELARSQAKEVLFELVLWSTLGAVAGILLAVGAYYAYRGVGWYQSQWKHARWVRRTAAVLTALVCAGLIGMAGFWHGVFCGSKQVLAKSQIATELLPVVGDAVAEGVVVLDEMMTFENGLSPDAIQRALQSVEFKEKVRSFRVGEREWDVTVFLGRMDRFGAEKLPQFVDETLDGLLNRYPSLKGGLGEQILRPVLTALVRRLVSDKLDPLAGVDKKLQKSNGIVIFNRQRLLAEAARAGNPATISHRELSLFVIQGGLVPAILKPIHSMARTQQIIMIVLSILIVSIPAVVFRLTNKRHPNAVKTAVDPDNVTNLRCSE